MIEKSKSCHSEQNGCSRLCAAYPSCLIACNRSNHHRFYLSAYLIDAIQMRVTNLINNMANLCFEKSFFGMILKKSFFLIQKIVKPAKTVFNDGLMRVYKLGTIARKTEHQILSFTWAYFRIIKKFC